MQSYNITDLFHPFADIQGSGVGGVFWGKISGSAHVLFCDTATQYCTIVHVTNCMLVLGSQ